MEEQQAYTCEKCGKGVELQDSSATPPECCNQTMIPVESLPACELSATAEHSRLADDSDPCDDGRGGN
jgi:hypothetical protein